ncbi:MAG: polysaccharide deacetylase family protein [Oscillospiraceae bacterium]|nr:polysaccharide deacetylase family protein [Oscillospiraceae bacterium]
MARFAKPMLAMAAALCLCLGLFACTAQQPPPATHSTTTHPGGDPFSVQPTYPDLTTGEHTSGEHTSEYASEHTQPVAVNPAGFPSREILRGSPSQGIVPPSVSGVQGTFTGLAPLPARPLAIADPNNSKNLPLKKIEHAYGAAKNGQVHEISITNQNFFEAKHYAAVAYDKITKEKVLYLTFDCGYENGNTAKILDVLKEKNVPAAFFCTVDEMKGAPEIVARMINEGHIVGNHSVKHPSFAEVDRTRMAQEVIGADNYLRENFGYSAPYFRFPKGEYNETALEAVASLGFTSVFWSCAYADWDVNAQKGARYALDTVLGRLHPGAVILLHSVSSDNAGAMAEIIDGARAMGYAFLDLTCLPQLRS